MSSPCASAGPARPTLRSLASSIPKLALLVTAVVFLVASLLSSFSKSGDVFLATGHHRRLQDKANDDVDVDANDDVLCQDDYGSEACSDIYHQAEKCRCQFSEECDGGDGGLE